MKDDDQFNLEWMFDLTFTGTRNGTREQSCTPDLSNADDESIEELSKRN